MLDFGLHDGFCGRIVTATSVRALPPLLPRPRSVCEGRIWKPGHARRSRQLAVARHQADGSKEFIKVVVAESAGFRRTGRRILIVTLYGCSTALAWCMSWGWLFFAGAVSAHLLLVGFWMTSAWVRYHLDFREAKDVRSGSWVLILTGPGKAALRKLSVSSKRFRYHGQQYELQGAGRDVCAIVTPQSQEPVLSLSQRYSNGGLEDCDVEARRQKYGSNDYRIAVPTIRHLVLLRLLRPIFLFELASVFLWGLDGYWQFTLLSLGTLVCFEVGAAMSRHKSLAQLRATATASEQVSVLRSGHWVLKPAAELVPGDIIQVRKEMDMPCDALLLDGSATASEAALSGESAPVTKSKTLPEPRNPDESDMHSILFAGTQVLAVRGNQDDTWCASAVLKTGFHCKQGLLMRRAIASQESIRDKDTLKVVLLLLCFATLAALQVVIHGKRNDAWLKTSIILSFVIQPTLPLLMTYAVQRALDVLRTKDIICGEPLRVLEAASMSTCLFDKTGTLTSDKLEVAGAGARTAC